VSYSDRDDVCERLPLPSRYLLATPGLAVPHVYRVLGVQAESRLRGSWEQSKRVVSVRSPHRSKRSPGMNKSSVCPACRSAGRSTVRCASKLASVCQDGCVSHHQLKIVNGAIMRHDVLVVGDLRCFGNLACRTMSLSHLQGSSPDEPLTRRSGGADLDLDGSVAKAQQAIENVVNGCLATY
jgi:hypothetical protein